MVGAGNRAPSEVSSGAVVDLLRIGATRGTERTALVAGGRSWTYADLSRLTASGLRELERLGIARGGRVALVGRNSPAYVVAYLSAQALGAVTVEIGASESPETIARLLEHAAAEVLVTDRKELLHSERARRATVSFDGLLDSAERSAPEAPPPFRVDDDGPASIVFTSGTSGLPKGVVLSHRNIRFVTEAILEVIPLSAEDRYGLVLPLSHTYGKSVLHTSLAAGGAVVLIDAFQDPGAFLSEVIRERVSALSLVPFHVAILLRRGELARRDLDRLRLLTVAGGSAQPESLDGLAAAVPTARLYFMYGLTEASTRASILSPEDRAGRRGSCGRAIPGVEIRIVGEDGRELQPAAVGRVEVRGPNVMLGYLGEPALTGETIVEGWLRTGDLGLLDRDGYLYIHGREKDIIKCAGERISPAEIEAVLQSHPGVSEAAVVGALDPTLGEAPKAFIVPRGDFRDVSALRVLCARSLSHHKIPRGYEFVGSLPRTPNGKVRKSVLRGEVELGA